MVISKIIFCLNSGQTFKDKLFLIFQTTKVFLLSHAGKHGHNFLKLSKARGYGLEFKGIKQHIRLRLQDLGLFYDIFMNEAYLGAIMEVKSLKIRENEIVIWDIGAHVGLVSLYFQSLLKENNLKILAVEPSKHNFTLLTKNLPKTRNITHENCAVSDQSKHGYLNESGLAFNNFLSQNGNEDEVTEVICFEDLLKKHPTNKIDIMKIDIEGAEYDFLQNIEDWTIRPRIIIIEFHHQEKTMEAKKRIEDLGIKLKIV